MKVKVTQSCPTLCDPTDYTVHGISQARILESVASPFSRVSSQPRGKTQVSQADSLPAEPPGKLKNTGVGSLSLFQRIFPSQESNWGLLHCRQILYQLSYKGNPCFLIITLNLPETCVYFLHQISWCQLFFIAIQSWSHYVNVLLCILILQQGCRVFEGK